MDKGAPVLTTDRLILRHWKEEDFALFAEMNGDPKVMEFFPSVLSVDESNTFAKKIEKELQEKKYGLWAVEVKETAQFIGFVGLHYQDFPAPFTPCLEIGWRLAHHSWGRGYAFEAASKVVRYAFDQLKLDEIVSFTSKLNTRSIKLMEKLGLKRNEKDDFDHPKLSEGHPLRRHVLYRLKNPQLT